MGHLHEKIDWTTTVFIVHKNKVLLRMHEKYHTLLAVGGHIELNEDPIQAAVRECKEEVGLDIEIYDPNPTPPPMGPRERYLPVPQHMNIHYLPDSSDRPPHQHIDLVYYATSNSDQVIPENDDDQWMWLSAEEVRTHTELSERTKVYALGALAALSTKTPEA